MEPNNHFDLKLVYAKNGDFIAKFEEVKIEDIVGHIMSTDRMDADGLIKNYLNSIQNQKTNETIKYILVGPHKKRPTEAFYLYVTKR